MNYVIGIDLGNTNCCVSVKDHDKIYFIDQVAYRKKIPAAVAFKASGEIIVGAPALNQAALNPKYTITNLKSLLGKNFSDLNEGISHLPYELRETGGDRVKIVIRDKLYTPEEIMAEILKEIKRLSTDFIKAEVNHAIVAVPANFNKKQYAAIRQSGELAGLIIRNIVVEPIAAVQAYYQNATLSEGSRIAVVDLGGETFDVSIVEIKGNGFILKSSSYDNLFGGNSFNRMLVDSILQDFKTETGIDLSDDIFAMQRIKEEAERIKIALSEETKTEISLAYITAVNNEPMNIFKDISRDEFENITDELYSRIKYPVINALRKAGLKTSQVDDVILIGGSALIPKVQRIIQEIFNKECRVGLKPGEEIALGAVLFDSNPGEGTDRSSTSQIFCSYDRENKLTALKLVKDMMDRGIDIWLDQLQISAGDNWDDRVKEALMNAEAVMVLYSCVSVNNTNVLDEAYYAKEKNKRIIPVLLEQCEVPWRLRRQSYIDLSADYSEGLQHVLKAARGEQEFLY